MANKVNSTYSDQQHTAYRSCGERWAQTRDFVMFRSLSLMLSHYTTHDDNTISDQYKNY